MASATAAATAIASFLDPAIRDRSEFEPMLPSQDYAKDLQVKTALWSTSVQAKNPFRPKIEGPNRFRLGP